MRAHGISTCVIVFNPQIDQIIDQGLTAASCFRSNGNISPIKKKKISDLT